MVKHPVAVGKAGSWGLNIRSGEKASQNIRRNGVTFCIANAYKYFIDNLLNQQETNHEKNTYPPYITQSPRPFVGRETEPFTHLCRLQMDAAHGP